MVKKITVFIKNKEGAETLEYIVIVAVILVFAVVAYDTSFTLVLQTAFNNLTSADVAPN